MALGKSKPILFRLNWKYISVSLMVFIFLVGQTLIVFKGRLSLGLLLSFFSALGGLAIYFFWARFISLLRNKRFKFQMKKKPQSRVKRALPRPNWFKNFLKSPDIPNKRFIVFRGMELFAAFGLGAIGQWYWLQEYDDSTLLKGAFAFFAAVVLFIHSFSPWFREGFQRLSISFKWEMIFLGFIIAVAVFLRVYRIDAIPSGLYVDQGFEGYAALRILREGWHPFYVEDVFHAYALALYMLAVWFKAFGVSEATLRLFYAFLGIISLPLIYWTFRQLAGPRMALLTLFILAVMRWNINFNRNAFPTVQLTLYMFGTLAFLLYGLDHGKRWAFFVAAFFFSAGFYTYQAFKIFPLLLVVYALYEWIVSNKMIKKHYMLIVGFFILTLILTAPILFTMIKTRNLGFREVQLMSHSFKQFLAILIRTSIMFNRKGDPNPRHNLQDYRMLDDVSGVLLVLGLAYSLARWRRRKYFYALAGFFVMSLPCLLSVDAAHANRMFGMTPYIAFLIAVPLGALWGRVLAFLGQVGEKVYLGLLVMPLGFMTFQNFDVYFNKQANNINCWKEYNCSESTTGREASRRGISYEYFISPNYFNDATIEFLGYSCISQMHSFIIPEELIPLQIPSNHGLFYALQEGKTGNLNFLQSIYPQGKAIHPKDIQGNDFVYFFEVPPTLWAKYRGLKAEISNVPGIIQVPEFPYGLPTGPYHAVFTGSVYISKTGRYRFMNLGQGSARLFVKRIPVLGSLFLEKGYWPIRIDWDAPPGAWKPGFALHPESGTILPLTFSCLTTAQIEGGLRAEYFPSPNWTGKAALNEWEPTPNFVNGNDFPISWGSALWEGKLHADVTGDYEFFTVTEDNALARLIIDGSEIIPLSPSRTAKIKLTRGKHRLQLFYRSPKGFQYLALKWRKPGMKDIEVIPEREFDYVSYAPN